MKVLIKSHKGLTYIFELYESTGEVCIIKEGQHTYTITDGFCDCPASKYHKYCWHTTVLDELKSQPSLNVPWSEWAEEASVMRDERRRVK